jgi:tetratricopeptide (TPR) repeat protein
MYLTLALAIGTPVFPTVSPSHQVVMEQSLDIVGDRSPKVQAELSPELFAKAQPVDTFSINWPQTHDWQVSNELKIAQQPPTLTTTNESTFQEKIDEFIAKANQYHDQKNFKKEAQALVVTGRYYFYFGVPRKGFVHIESALKIYRQTNDYLGQSDALNALAQIHEGLGEYPKALEYHRQSIAIFEKFISNKKHTPVLMVSLSGMASVNANLGDTKEELKYMNKILQVAKESGDVKIQAAALRYNSSRYFLRGHLKQALQYNKEAAALDPK